MNCVPLPFPENNAKSCDAYFVVSSTTWFVNVIIFQTMPNLHAIQLIALCPMTANRVHAQSTLLRAHE